jgi:hypothetical protein
MSAKESDTSIFAAGLDFSILKLVGLYPQSFPISGMFLVMITS